MEVLFVRQRFFMGQEYYENSGVPHYPPQQALVQSDEPSSQGMSNKERAAVQIKFITNAATQVELLETKNGIPTLHFEQAPIVTKQGQRQGNWSSKVIFQLSPNTELQQFIDFLTNRITAKSIKFKFHGTENNKTMSLTKNNDGTLMLGLSHGPKSQSGVIQPTGVSQILLLAYKAYADRFMVSVSDVICILNNSPVAELPKQQG